MPVIRVENLSKAYRLGQIGGATLREELNRWWARVRKRPDPKLKIGQEHLAERFGERFWALKDVSFEAEQGEVLGIIGRNGSGKSTLLKVLSQVTAPTEGVVKIKGRVASLLEVGTGFHPELTGRENIFLNGAILGMTKGEIQRKFDEIVAFSEVEQFIDTPVKRYSSGMYVRLAFAVAAHLEPEILIVDEVLAVGDAAFQRKCLGKMGDVAQEGRTVLFVSHNMVSVQNLCSACILLGDGRMTALGATRDVVQAYLYEGGASRHVSLAERSDREGDGSIRLTCLLLNGKAATEEALLRSGDDISLQISYAAATRVDSPVFYVGIYDLAGVQIANVNTQMARIALSRSSREGILTCRIPRLPLPPGGYLVTLAVAQNGRLADRVQGAAELRVQEGDFFGTGDLHGAASGLVLVDHSWTVSELADRAPGLTNARPGWHGSS
ncbi:MAG TPA: ABC transporter ATP-binding protein [Chthonomonadales bacterium]|nr:ABC transporter ATP-binding protein [Chthonomonadales bacterium]